MNSSDTTQKMIHSIAGQCLSVRIRLLNRLVTSIFDDALRPHGIRASQLNILVAVSVHGAVTSRELCRALYMDSSTFSRAITRLKNKGWLRSEPSGEGKILRIEATRQGLELIRQVYADWEKAQQKAEAVLGQETTLSILTAGNKHLFAG